MCVPVASPAVKISFSFLFTVVVCVASQSACCALFVLPVAIPVAYGVGVTGIAGLVISAVISISWPWVFGVLSDLSEQSERSRCSLDPGYFGNLHLKCS